MTNIDTDLEARIDAILALPEAANRTHVAKYIAHHTKLDVEQARDMLLNAEPDPVSDTSHSMNYTNGAIYQPINQEG